MACPFHTQTATNSDDQVSTGLNLWLTLEDPSKMGELLLKLNGAQPSINLALKNLRDVHFARFLPTPGGEALQVITSFDGELDAYVLDFAQTIGDAFDVILAYVKGASTLIPVRDHAMAFMNFIRANNIGSGVFSAYPGKTVVEIEGRDGVLSQFQQPADCEVDRSDVQANVLRGVRAKAARHVALGIDLSVDGRALARSFLAKLRDGTNGLPQLTSDASWTPATRPECVLNLGFTYNGLQNLGLSQEILDTFALSFPAFAQGPAQYTRAQANGDVGAGNPVYWAVGGPNNPSIDMMLTIYGFDHAALEKQYQLLSAAWQSCGLQEISHFDAKALGNSAKVHFGYEDGMAQPQLAIADIPAKNTDMQPRAGVGEFLLGEHYPNIYGGKDSLGGLPAALANNATFGAWRMMEQDVVAFEALLESGSRRFGVDKEWLAAKLMGRWRNGTPLTQSPGGAGPGLSANGRNHFDYAPTLNHPNTFDDWNGERCPLGSHIRRMNPRGSRVAGKPYSRRVLRRSLPYGPELVPGENESMARGLVGFFLCADLDRQFEFLLRQWGNGDAAAHGIRGQQDPILGAQLKIPGGPSMTAQFSCLSPDGQSTITFDMPRLVKTVGAAHLFMPGLEGVRYLSQLRVNAAADPRLLQTSNSETNSISTLKHIQDSGNTFTQAPKPSTAPPIDVTTFDPETNQAYRKDPYPIFDWFRANQPVAYMPALGSYWVFDHAGVDEVTSQPTVFCKRPLGDTSPAGLLSMDPPYHLPCKDAIQALLDTIVADPATDLFIQRTTSRLINACKGRTLDFMEDVIRPLNVEVFFHIFGLDVSQQGDLIAKVRETVSTISARRTLESQNTTNAAMQAVGGLLAAQLTQARPGGLLSGIANLPLFDPPDNTHPNAIGITMPAAQVEHIANATSLVLGGFFPTEWLVQRATVHLLDARASNLQTAAKAGVTAQQCLDELLRFDTPLQMSDRFVHADGVEIHGVALPKNACVVVLWGSANRDEAAFGPDANTVNFARGKGPAWGFGGTGEHRCVGQTLANKVVGAAIDALLAMADYPPHLTQGYGAAWSVGPYFRRLESLMVTFP